MKEITYDGNIHFDNGTRYYGYKAVHRICNAVYSGSHMCTADEIQMTIVDQNTGGFSETAWIIENAPGYWASANDCEGYKNNADTVFGAFWDFTNEGGGDAWLTGCNYSKKLPCCS